MGFCVWKEAQQPTFHPRVVALVVARTVVAYTAVASEAVDRTVVEYRMVVVVRTVVAGRMVVVVGWVPVHRKVASEIARTLTSVEP